MPLDAINGTYWVLLIAFGLMGMWHAVLPVRKGQEWRTAFAALILYVMLGIIGLRYFLL